MGDLEIKRTWKYKYLEATFTESELERANQKETKALQR